MKLKGTVEIEESNYRKALELAFTDYLEEAHNILNHLENI